MATIQAHKDALLKPLSTVTGIVEKRHTMPILSNVLVETQGGQLRLLGTDLEIQIQTVDALEGNSSDTRFTTSAKKLQDILRAVPDGNVTLELEANKLLVKAGKSRFNLHTLPADDLPQVQLNAEVQASLTLAQKDLKALLNKVSYSMANQDIRYYLNGLYLVVNGGKLRLVATDGHRLGYCEHPLDGDANACEAIIPRKTVLELAKLLADVDDPIRIDVAGNQIRFRFGNIDLVSKVIEGKFPDYNRVIPVGNNRSFNIERSLLQGALQRVAILSNEKFRGVRVTLSQGVLKIQSTNSEQEEAVEELDVDYGSDALDIGFNITYLIDVLTHGDTETVHFALADSNGSALVTEPGNDAFKYVVMPMRI